MNWRHPSANRSTTGRFACTNLVDGRSYEYLGTVEIPENLDLLAGDSERVAGVQRDELGVQSVRVLAVEFN